jgi:PAS domain S-box-containing protein
MAYLNINRNVHRGFSQWNLAFMMNFVGFVLLSLRHILPVFITVTVANTLILLCYVFIMHGLNDFADADQNIWLDVSFVGVFIIGFWVFSHIHPNVTARIIIISVAMSLICMRCCAITYIKIPLQLGKRNLLLVTTFTLAAMFFLVRIPMTLAFEGGIGDFMSPSVIQGLSIIGVSIVHIFIAIGLIIINGQHLEAKLNHKTSELIDLNNALMNSESKFRSLSDAAFEGIVISEEGTILEANNTLAKMFGYKSTELFGAGRKITDFVIPGLRKTIQNKIASGHEEAYEAVGLKQDGTQFPIAVQGKMYEYKGRQVRVAAIRDLTEQKKTEVVLRESERMKGVLEMAGAVCHEMSQPLMAAIGYSDLITAEVSKDDPLGDWVLKLRAQVNRAGKITKRLMKMAKYMTKEYPQGKIIDIEKATEEG